jgi:hypothetical protein
MPSLKQTAIALIAEVIGADFNVDTDLTLYTVPAGKVFTPFGVLITNASANMTSAVVSFGQSGAKTDFLSNMTLSNVAAAGNGCWCIDVPTTTPPMLVMYTAGEIFVMDRVTAAGIACTADIQVFGVLNDA